MISQQNDLIWNRFKTQSLIISLRSHKDVMKETIPILSSCLSGGLILMASLVSVLLIALLDYESDLKPMISRGFLILVMSVHIPLILWITVKNQKKNKKPVAPAKTLQFHGVSSKWMKHILQNQKQI